MTLPPVYRRAEELEEHLGDPSSPASPVSFLRSVALDEREEYPEDEVRTLDDWGLHRHYVPAPLGGELRSYEELLALSRVVARRDFTLALTHALSYVGASFVWVAGSEEQKARLAALILRRGQVAAAFHEQAHGNDLLSCEVQAVPRAGGFVLSGEKWVIGNARRSAALSLFARTDEREGPRGFSLLLVEKDALPAESVSYLPKFKTHGIRAHEIAGIRFAEAPLGGEALIGPLGAGLEVALLSSQVTRTLACALSLGAADTALRATLDFALSRRLYGEAVFDIPHAQRQLVRAFLDLLVCDCVATAATRAIQGAPAEMSVASAVAKHFVSTTVEEIVHDLSVVLGARHYLREGHWAGIFQKILRDCVFTRLTHFSSIISLSQLGVQLRELLEPRAGTTTSNADVLRAMFDLAAVPPPFDPKQLGLTSRGRDTVAQGLEGTVLGLDTRSDGHADVLSALAPLVGELRDERDRLRQDRAALERRLGPDLAGSAELIGLAERYVVLWAAAACLHTWLNNRGAGLDPFFSRGAWLPLCLDRLLGRLSPGRLAPRLPFWGELASELSTRQRGGRSFGLVPLRLAAGERREARV